VQVKKQIDEKAIKIKGFLHKIHFCPELKSDALKIPCKVNRKIMIKENNYLEGYPIFTASLDKLAKKEVFWKDLKVG